VWSSVTVFLVGLDIVNGNHVRAEPIRVNGNVGQIRPDPSFRFPESFLLEIRERNPEQGPLRRDLDVGIVEVKILNGLGAQLNDILAGRAPHA